MIRHRLGQPLETVVGQLTVRLPFLPGPTIADRGSESISSGVTAGVALAAGLAKGDEVGEGEASTDGLGDTLGDGLGEGLGEADFVTLITNRLWHDCDPQPVMVAVRTTLLPASPDVSISTIEGSCDDNARPAEVVQLILIRRGSMTRPLHVYCNFRFVFPSVISRGIPKIAQLLGSCRVGGRVCCGTSRVNPALIVRAASEGSNSSEPDRIATPGIAASFDPTSISTDFVFGGRKL